MSITLETEWATINPEPEEKKEREEKERNQDTEENDEENDEEKEDQERDQDDENDKRDDQEKRVETQKAPVRKGVRKVSSNKKEHVQSASQSSPLSDKKAYPIFLILSYRTLPDIRKILSDYVKSTKSALGVGPMRVERRGKYDTNRTLVTMDPVMYQAMVKDGLRHDPRTNRRDYGDFKIKKYQVAPKLPPRDKRTLKIILHNGLNIDQSRDRLDRHMQEMVRFGIVPDGSWEVFIPFKSRETDEHNGCGFIVFNEMVNVWDMVATNLMLSESIWTDRKGRPMKGDHRFVSTFWTRLTASDIDMSPADRAKRHGFLRPNKPHPKRGHEKSHHSPDHQSNHPHSPHQHHPHHHPPHHSHHPPHFRAPPKVRPPKVNLNALPFMKREEQQRERDE